MHELFEWDDNWRLFAKCEEPAPWKLHTPQNVTIEEAEDFKKMCGGCDAQEDCLEYALVTRQPFNIWGGKTAHERQEIR